MDQEHREDGVKRVEAGFGASGEPLPEMPLKLVVFSELMPRDLRSGSSSERRQRVRIDRQSLEQVMAGFGLRAFVDVPDRLAGGKDPLIVEVEIRDLKSFRPEALAERVPAAHDLLRLRGALSDLRSAKLRLADVFSLLGSLGSRSAVLERVRNALETEAAAPAAGSPAPPAPTEGGLDALLEKVAIPDASSGPAAGRGADLNRLDALVRQLVRSSRTSDQADPRAVEGAIREIDAAVSAQVDGLLHHAEIRRLEAAWRGLFFLIRRRETD